MNYKVLRKQMCEKMEQSKEAREQYLKEKDQVDHLVKKIIDEDKQLIKFIFFYSNETFSLFSFLMIFTFRYHEFKEVKKQQQYQSMLKAFTEKEQKLMSEKAREKEENEQYLQFIRDKDAKATEIKVKKAEINAAKF